MKKQKKSSAFRAELISIIPHQHIKIKTEKDKKGEKK